ncbi:TPA: hypothetical protein TUL06_000878 [Streptococcus equi subsp. zooepidemicus]|uniref:hypothetical protein n=1 Tax=Streptococcus equi TaxID=1336 RepID=UPI000DA3E3E6|nr:hypothetical protein [Streptococcus equi]VED85113.1 Uncharacterised protein [Streptococcus equi subsp. equi]MCD3400485.1 hypothetical protein [Streptococcus equi subsp. zooepidemicus]MCD3413947.1 hypothetical protein [Streptococcus equi subsp. zooepidemicus]MCD3431429.1 hypothetical protein [Streptococcus equi subsp. zooepidemicus]QGM23097.1 hypothetical protein GJS33_02670 [Streptococcus equi subsp. zooepidemicus]
MSEQYLSIKESLGYKNVKQALWTIFSANLDEISIHEGEDENFNFVFTYKNCEMMMGIYDTGKNIQFQAGEGGLFSVSLPNPKYPKQSFQKIVSLSYLISDKNVSENIRWCLGLDMKSVEYAMRVLKDYLDQKCEEEQ